MPYNVQRMYLSHSSMETFRSCPRKFEFRKMFRRPGRDRFFDAEVGKCLHSGYQTWLATGGDRDAGIFAMMKEYPVNMERNENAPKSLEASYATLMAMFDATSMMEYQIAEVQCLDGQLRKAIEVPFQIHLKGLELIPGIPVYYIGYIDMIGFNQLKNRYEVIDIKTHRNNLNDLSAEYKWHDQCIPYTIAVETTIGRELDSLTVNYLSCYVDIENPVISRYPFHKDKTHLRDWARGLLIDLQQMKMFIEMEWWMRHGNSCSAWRRQCDFFSICEERSVETIREFMLRGQEPYVEPEFEPWIKMELELVA